MSPANIGSASNIKISSCKTISSVCSGTSSGLSASFVDMMVEFAVEMSVVLVLSKIAV